MTYPLCYGTPRKRLYFIIIRSEGQIDVLLWIAKGKRVVGLSWENGHFMSCIKWLVEYPLLKNVLVLYFVKSFYFIVPCLSFSNSIDLIMINFRLGHLLRCIELWGFQMALLLYWAPVMVWFDNCGVGPRTFYDRECLLFKVELLYGHLPGQDCCGKCN